MSDDSHGIAQIATHYAQAFEFLEETGVDNVAWLEKDAHGPSSKDSRFPGVRIKTINVAALKMEFFS